MYLNYMCFIRERKNLLSTYLCKTHSPYVCGTNCSCGSRSKPFNLQIGLSFCNGVFNGAKGNHYRLKSIKLFWPNMCGLKGTIEYLWRRVDMWKTMVFLVVTQQADLEDTPPTTSDLEDTSTTTMETHTHQKNRVLKISKRMRNSLTRLN